MAKNNNLMEQIKNVHLKILSVQDSRSCNSSKFRQFYLELERAWKYRTSNFLNHEKSDPRFILWNQTSNLWTTQKRPRTRFIPRLVLPQFGCLNQHFSYLHLQESMMMMRWVFANLLSVQLFSSYMDGIRSMCQFRQIIVVFISYFHHRPQLSEINVTLIGQIL